LSFRIRFSGESLPCFAESLFCPSPKRPVLEDADSIQITLGQIMRMIVCRQVEPRVAGLLLYGLQIACTNLRRTRFERGHEESVTLDLLRVPERIIGDDARSPADFSPADFKDADGGGRPRPPNWITSIPSNLKSCNPSSTGALKGDWRDVKTLFEFAGIFPPKDNTSPTDA
jgi:hypothetical protein